MNDQKDFLTKDLYIGALLYASGLNFEGVIKSGSVCWFKFANLDMAEKIAADYFSGKVMVNCKTYADSLRTLKNVIFQGSS